MAKELRIGIIGYDTSHVPAFTKLINDPSDPFYVAGGKVVCGFPSFSPDLKASYSRVEGFEARPVIDAGKPLYIDKPLAADYKEAAEIVRLAREKGCPIFSSSSLRYDVNIRAILADPDLGAVFACDAFSPATLDPTNPGLFWYGVHGVEILFTFMGTGCEKVTCYTTEDSDVIVGTWAGGRLGTMRGTRSGAHDYGVTAFGEGKVMQATYSHDVPLYSRLLEQIMPFFQGGPAPVDPEETLEIMAFMQAALISGQEGREVTFSEVR